MIRYALKCDNGHGFESWFRSAEAFDGLCAAHRLECPDCGSREIAKALMAPSVTSVAAPAQPRPPVPQERAAEAAEHKAIQELRAQIEANSDYVGRRFAREARAMHEGTLPNRAIHGEANAEEARALLRDGVPVMPLPFRDRRGTN